MSVAEAENSARSHGQSSRAGGQVGVLVGLVLIAFVCLAFAALATWSVDDPSLSNSNGRAPTNLLGFAGAVFADLAIQFAGLASATALIPVAIWGWTKLLREPIGRWRRRLTAWFVSLVLAAAGFACVAVPQTWPLPTGLGGIAGDMVLRIPARFTGAVPASWLAAVLALVFFAAALVSMFYAAGLIRQAGEPEAEDFDEDEGHVALALGAAAHWLFMLRSRFRRRTPDPADPARPSRFAEAFAAIRQWMNADDDGLGDEGLPIGVRREPGFADSMALDSAAVEPDWGEHIYPAEEAEIAGDWSVPAEPAVECEDPGRVRPMAAKPRRSNRQTREAQGSLLPDRFELPQLHLLGEPKGMIHDPGLTPDALEQNARLLEGVLEDFGVKGEIINIRPGPVVTLYELEPAPGIKSSRVIGLADDIARSMSAIAARVAVVPGRNAIGIELPNQRRQTVYLREILASEAYDKSKAGLALTLGKTIGGEPVIADLAKMPHLLVAGTTGSGKSVAINTMILSILYRRTPEQVKLIMIDPKMLELSIYDGIPHLLTPVVTDPKKAVVALKWTVREMEERYRKMSKLGVRNIDGYNARLGQAASKGEALSRTVQTGYNRETGEAIFETEELDLEPMPFIVVIIDEMADLMMVAGKDIEGAIQRLAQMARAAGIHVIMATQRPSVDVITGTIKANFPTRISFQVTSKIDSRTILGEQGAEQLLGMGDMLYMAGGGRIQRVHGPFVGDGEVEQVVSYLKTQGVPEYLDAVTEDDGEDEVGGGGSGDGLSESADLYDQAVAIVLRDRKVSTSYIQRRLSIGYNRAATLIERMEQEGVIGAANHAGKREILVPGEEETL